MEIIIFLRNFHYYIFFPFWLAVDFQLLLIKIITSHVVSPKLNCSKINLILNITHLNEY